MIIFKYLAVCLGMFLIVTFLQWYYRTTLIPNLYTKGKYFDRQVSEEGLHLALTRKLYVEGFFRTVLYCLIPVYNCIYFITLVILCMVYPDNFERKVKALTRAN